MKEGKETKIDKSLKFKIEIVPDVEPTQLRIQFLHQQGILFVIRFFFYVSANSSKDITALEQVKW
jgi:hypothetical protein